MFRRVLPLFFIIVLAMSISLSTSAIDTAESLVIYENTISQTSSGVIEAIPEAFNQPPLLPAAGSTVMNPPMPCANGVRGNFTTAHRYPMGTGPYSDVRIAYDIRCGAQGGGNATDLRIFSPTTGRVYAIVQNSNPDKRGMFITDTTYGGCFLVWHITASVSNGQWIQVSTLLGHATGAGGHVHVAWSNLPCNGRYGNEVARSERPVQWREIGYVLPRLIYVSQMGRYNFVSQNPAGGGGGGQLAFARDTRSTIAINTAEVSLSITGSNIAGKTVYARLCRAAANGYPAKSWSYSQVASSNTAFFGNLDGVGSTFAGVTYYTVASLNPISEADCYKFRTACAVPTYVQYCDSARR